MIREDVFRISRRPYAVKLDSLYVEPRDWGAGCDAEAVWFRRRRGVTVACWGTIWTTLDPAPADAVEFLDRHDDGRYGGHCVSRWDGTSYWGNTTLETQEKHLAILRPMLDNYPAIPPGYDGWWRF